MLFNKEQVQEWLPHREPFFFVDSIESITPLSLEKAVSVKEIIGNQVVGHYRTRPEHPVFQGHFPGRPILPGVIQIEIMAQVSTFVLVRLYPSAKKRDIHVVLVGVERAKFKRPIGPEENLKIQSQCKMIRGDFVVNECEIYVEDHLCGQATCTVMVRPQ